MTSKTTQILQVVDHSRDSAGCVYVYPVVSRRAGGVSVGINLNPNNACNWRCVYCQVPDLIRGGAPQLDLELMQSELRHLLHDIVHGDFMQTRVPPEARRLNDVAFSGNGEPTSSVQFLACVEGVAAVLQEFELVGKIKLVLITNGSQLDREQVQTALGIMRDLGGEVWFKLDRAPLDGFSVVNQIQHKQTQVARRLMLAAQHCPTWIQTCMFEMDGALPDEEQVTAYLDFLQERIAAGVQLEGVLLYGLARPSMQAEASRLLAAPSEWMQKLAQRIAGLGLEVKLSL
ncbi:radical SAM protein [Janthinobacterium sp. B9-8]|uniref:radical SAM protein n=1 Tax=Janthinobacterium sp. B9-8 TaxID=1236179 RepID=UPI00061CDCBC|nr:radical SAM protein [Janthinobacterium sp. B9-8]AMC33906.1 radical SAM protein [Janthinobacterium sp. B9-8]